MRVTDYDWRQLAERRERITPAVPEHDITRLGSTSDKTRITVGVEAESGREAITQLLAELGVPEEAVPVRIAPPGEGSKSPARRSSCPWGNMFSHFGFSLDVEHPNPPDPPEATIDGPDEIKPDATYDIVEGSITVGDIGPDAPTSAPTLRHRERSPSRARLTGPTDDRRSSALKAASAPVKAPGSCAS